MSPQTMTEKDQFIAAWDREYETTRRILDAYPAGKDDFKPAEKSRTARELAWIFIMEEKVIDSALKGAIEFTSPPPPPQVPVSEIIRMYESAHREHLAGVKAAPPEAFDRTVKFPVGPKQMSDVRTGQVAWMMLMDAIHHRGQFSVYLRMVGAKVPSIYGPTADEPWK